MNQTKPRIQDINELKQSVMSYEYYFVLRGKRLPKGMIQASKKVDVTNQIHYLLVQWMFNISDDLCPFCGCKPTSTQEINRKTDDIKLVFHLCDTCKIILTKQQKEQK